MAHVKLCEVTPPQRENLNENGWGMTEQITPRFVTVSEVAEVMRVSKMTVYRMIHAGNIPAVRVGKSYRVPMQALTKIINTSAEWEQGTQAEAI